MKGFLRVLTDRLTARKAPDSLPFNSFRTPELVWSWRGLACVRWQAMREQRRCLSFHRCTPARGSSVMDRYEDSVPWQARSEGTQRKDIVWLGAWTSVLILFLCYCVDWSTETTEQQQLQKQKESADALRDRIERADMAARQAKLEREEEMQRKHIIAVQHKLQKQRKRRHRTAALREQMELRRLQADEAGLSIVDAAGSNRKLREAVSSIVNDETSLSIYNGIGEGDNVSINNFARAPETRAKVSDI